MNSRERITKIFEWDVPDKVGRYEQSVYSSVGSSILGREAHTGGTTLHWFEAISLLQGGSAHDEFIDRVYRDRSELGKALRFDMTGIPWLMPQQPAGMVDDYEIIYGDPEGEDWAVYRYDVESQTYGQVDSAQKDETTEDLRRYVARLEKETAKGPKEEPFYVAYLKRLLKDFDKDLAVLGASSISIPLTEPWLIATITDPALVGAYLDVQKEIAIREINRQAEMGVKIIWGGGDLADNHGPLYSPEVFREIVLPRIKEIMETCHDLEMWYVFRTDGDIWPVADMLLDEAEVDGYGEIDANAGMDLKKLKERFPRTTFWGAVPPAVIRDQPKFKVLEAAKYCIDAVGADRRLILGSANSILPGTPVENVYALTEAVDEWGLAGA